VTCWGRGLPPALALSRGTPPLPGLQQASTAQCRITSSTWGSGISGECGLKHNHLPRVCSAPNKADKASDFPTSCQFCYCPPRPGTPWTKRAANSSVRGRKTWQPQAPGSHDDIPLFFVLCLSHWLQEGLLPAPLPWEETWPAGEAPPRATAKQSQAKNLTAEERQHQASGMAACLPNKKSHARRHQRCNHSPCHHHWPMLQR